MHNYCNTLDLAYDHGHCQVVEFLLSKGAKANNCKKVSNINYISYVFIKLQMCDCICNEGHSYTCIHVTFQIRGCVTQFLVHL